MKIVCDIVKERDLHVHTKKIREIIISDNISDEHKISLLKIKLDFIINVECNGKIRFLLMAILARIITFMVSGFGGLELILEPLYRLFKEGRISKAFYNQILKVLARHWEWQAISVEHLVD